MTYHIPARLGRREVRVFTRHANPSQYWIWDGQNGHWANTGGSYSSPSAYSFLHLPPEFKEVPASSIVYLAIPDELRVKEGL